MPRYIPIPRDAYKCTHARNTVLPSTKNRRRAGVRARSVRSNKVIPLPGASERTPARRRPPYFNRTSFPFRFTMFL